MFKKIKYGLQRYRRGYSDEDTWDFHSYLCDIIIPVLREFSIKKMGCPSSFWDDNSKNNECHRWSEALETMVQGFEAAKAINSMQYYETKKNEDGNWSYELDKEKMKLLTKKYNEGMKIFCDNFLSLWD